MLSIGSGARPGRALFLFLVAGKKMRSGGARMLVGQRGGAENAVGVTRYDPALRAFPGFRDAPIVFFREFHL